MQALRSFLVIERDRPKFRLIPLGSLALLVGLLEVAALALVAPAIALLGNSTSFVQISIIAWFNRHFPGLAWHQALLLIIGLLFGVYLCKAVLQMVYYRQQTSLVARWQSDLANRLVRSYLNAPYQRHLQRNSAELIRNVTTLVQPFYVEFLNAALGIAVDLSAMTALIVVLLVIAPIPTLTAGVLLVVIYTAQHRLFQRLHGRLGAENAELMRLEQQSLQQSFGAFKELRVLRSNKHFIDQFADLSQRLADNIARFEFSRRLPPIFGELTMILCVTVAVLAMVVLVPDPSKFIVAVGVLAAAAFRLSPLANRIVGAIGTISRAQPALALLAQEVESDRTASATNFSALTLKGTVALRNVSFRYPGRDRDALENIDFEIKPGEMIGIVGPSGAGKTTMVDILLGLLRPTSGTVFVDGKPLGADERLIAGYVPQEIFIFDDTLRRNVALGIPDHEIDDDRVWQALRLVTLESFAKSLSRGLDMPLAERGSALSGGQRQRVAIARGLYATPSFLVMDEATSALDAETEHTVAETISGLRTRTSILIIAHRLSTVMACDRLVFMADGRIIDQAPFAELRERNAQFRQMVELATRHDGGQSRPTQAELQTALFSTSEPRQP